MLRERKGGMQGKWLVIWLFGVETAWGKRKTPGKQRRVFPGEQNEVEKCYMIGFMALI